MLYVVTKNDVLTWHTGDTYFGTSLAADVIEIQADGDELIFILSKGVNLPIVKSALVIRWFGADAQFIAANILS